MRRLRKVYFMSKRQRNGTGTFCTRADGTLQYRVSMGIGSDGVAIRKSFYGKTQKECIQKYTDWIKDGRNVSIEKVKTVGEWADKWLEIYKKDQVAYSTYRNYKMYVDNHIKPKIGGLKFQQVRHAHIAALYAGISELSDSARHHIYVTLNGIFDTAVANRFCSDNPIVPPSKIHESKEIQIFSLPDIRTILESTKPNAAYPQLLLYTGLRIGELMALKWSDISEDMITVSKAITRDPQGGYTEGATKSKRIRLVAMQPPLAALLETLPKQGIYILANPDSSHLTPHQFERRYHSALTAIGVPYLSPHKCRHTYGTYLIKGGADLRSVQVLLGHSKSTTTEIYTHVDTDDIKNNVAKLKY